MIPKFRAWNTKSGRFAKDGELFLSIDSKNYNLYSVDFDNFRLENDNYILMQSTGLRDKNGVEVYEGDIVENTTQTVYLGHKFEVVWNKNYASYQLMNNGFTSNIPLEQHFMSYEVIGNIYENPELLEVEDE